MLQLFPAYVHVHHVSLTKKKKKNCSIESILIILAVSVLAVHIQLINYWSDLNLKMAATAN